MPVASLRDLPTLRSVLDALSRRIDGSPAAATTMYRKRAVFYNALDYAMERKLLPANPIDQVQWSAPEVAETVDRRVVASPAQVKQLLTAVRSQGDRNAHLYAYFAVLYFAGLRPSEGSPCAGITAFCLSRAGPSGSDDIGTACWTELDEQWMPS